MGVISTVTPTVSSATGYTLGSELLTNPEMSSDTAWTKGAGWLYFSDTFLTFGNAAGALSQSVTTVDGAEYRIAMQIGATAAPGITADFGGVQILDAIGQDTYVVFVTASGTSNTLEFNDGTAAVSVLSASIKRVTR